MRVAETKGESVNDDSPELRQPIGQPNRGRRSQRDVAAAQELIYQFLLEIVQSWSPEAVLDEFRRLFIEHVNTTTEGTLPALYEIVFANQEQEFVHTLKRSCYILINNWETSRNYEYVQKLIQLFDSSIIDRPTISPTLKRLRSWLKRFIQSSDFQQIKLFASRHDGDESWTQRYVSYLLVPQYVNLENPVEQREAAKLLSQKLKEKFKFDLAMYTACSQSASARSRQLENPTALGDEVLRMVKLIVARRGQVSYTSIARLFLKQTQGLSYQEFKTSLKKYLILSIGQPDLVATLEKRLTDKLDSLYTSYHDREIDDALLLRTCNRVIEFLTTEDRQTPSSLFILLLSEGNPLTLVVILLKLVLICSYSKTHLEMRIADLITYYSEYSTEQCQWVINFLEIFRITMTIHAENVEYNLVDMQAVSKSEIAKNSEGYRIFSQSKRDSVADQNDVAIANHLSADDNLESGSPFS